MFDKANASVAYRSVSAQPKTPRVCVAIPTYRRADQLERLLLALTPQSYPDNHCVEVIVFDNDVERSAESVLAKIRETFPVALTYVHVPEPGLSSVRNRILAFAHANFDYLAMIDDDEEPERQWLGELLRISQRTGADATFGPVRFTMSAAVPRWLRDGGFFDMPVRVRDGEAMDFGYSGNCILKLASIRKFGTTFDRSMNFAGGEDLVFFRTLLKRGAKFAFAARAQTNEFVVTERARVRYILQLNYRRGNTLALSDALLSPGLRGSAIRATKGVFRIIRGFVGFVPMVLFKGRRGALLATCDFAHGVGSLSGLFGVKYEGYKRVDARTS